MDFISNGFGSFIHHIVVRVESSNVNGFSEAFNSSPFRVGDNYSDFKITIQNMSRGDDETIMYEIDHKLPFSKAFAGWQILWDEL